MKSFSQFMLIAEDKMGERLGNMSDADFEQFLKGRTSGESQTYKEKRVKFKTTNVSSKNAGFGSQSNTQTPPRASTPPNGAPRASTPPNGAPRGSTPFGTFLGKNVATAEKTAAKTVGKNLFRGAGKLIGPASAALDVADERAKGSGWLRSLAKGATVAAGGALGGAAGTAAGPVGTVVGAGAGSMAASKAFDTAAGANAVQRKAIATGNRQGQAGGAIKGIGGKTTFDTRKNIVTTGVGSQRKTAQLGKTSVVTGPGGKKEVGHLAYKNGQAVYKRADTKNLAQTSSNPWERIGRTINPNAYKQSDAANAAKNIAMARQSDATRNRALGVKFGPGK